jgi:hypothetical protein
MEQITDAITSLSFLSPDQGKLTIPAGDLQPLAGMPLHLLFGVLALAQDRIRPLFFHSSQLND